MHLVDKVCRVANTHKRAARVDVVLPAIQFLVALEGHVVPLVFRLKE